MNPGSILITDALIPSLSFSQKTGWISVCAGKIHSFGVGKPPDILIDGFDVVNAAGGILLPGFIDIHTHGALGVNLITATPQEIYRVSEFLASHGVTGFLITSWSASRAEIHHMLETVQECMGKEPGASILGVHLEGPFINPTRAGAQSPKEIRPALLEEVEEYLNTGLIRIVSLAPEIMENRWLTKECVRKGISVSAGHTDATYDEMVDAVNLGLTQVTHCFNGMRSFSHREPGVVGAAMELDSLSCELIVDRIHVHPAAVRLLFKTKGPEKLILVTDSIPGTGLGEGSFRIQEQEVRFSKGVARLENGTLAGSLLTMDLALRNLVEITGQPVEICAPCATTNPAMAIGMGINKGRIREGSDGDLVLLDSNLQVTKTILNGRIVLGL